MKRRNRKSRKSPPATRLDLNLPRTTFVAAVNAAKQTGQSVEAYLDGLMAKDAAAQEEKIQLHITPHQLDILMRAVETLFQENTGCDDSARSIGGLVVELEHAARVWGQSEDDCADPLFYDIVRVAPAYIQLLKIWKSKPRSVADNYDFSDRAELEKFVTIALAACRT